MSTFMIPIYFRELSVEEYGAMAIILIIASFFELFGNLRLQTAVQTYYFDYSDKPRQLLHYISNIFTFSILFSLSLLLIFFLAGPHLLDIILKGDDIDFYPDIVIALSASFMSLNLRIYFNFIKNQKSFLEFALYSVSLVVLSVVFQLFFLFGMDGGLTGILLGKLVGTAIVFLFFIIKNRYLINFDLKKKFIRPSINYSVALLPFIVFFWANQKIDRFFLERLLDMTWVGKYAALIAITTLIRNIVDSGINSFRPFLFEFYKKGREENQDKILLLERVFLYMVFLAASLIVLAASNLELLVDNPKYLEVMHLAPLATLIPVLMGMAQLFNQQLIFSKNAKRISKVSMFSFAIVTPLYYFLIPQFKLEGLIFANILGNFIVAVLFYYYGKKHYPVKHDIKTILLLPLIFYSLIFGMKYLSDIAFITYSEMGIIQFIVFVLGVLFVGRKDLFSFLAFRK